jgi:hypothetical protein
VLLAAATPARAEVRAVFVYETGAAYVAQNDGRYGAGGTAYEAGDVGQQKNLARVERASVELGRGRHTLILLYAPFQLVTRVTLEEDLQFRDTLFPAGTPVDHRYLFDGYRASYLYTLLPDALRLDLGGSLQVRNADVAFTSVDGELHDAQDDIGVVFALKARIGWQPESGPWALLEADALSTFGLLGDTEGAIYDVVLSLGVPINERLDVYTSVRLLGGGADVAEQDFENWGDFVSAAAGLRLRFGS